MMATVSHVTSGLGLRKFQADGFLLTRVYLQEGHRGCLGMEISKSTTQEGGRRRRKFHSGDLNVRSTLQQILQR